MSFADERSTMAQVKAALAAFNRERDWEQFHTPKDLAMCLAAEAGELLEPFLWKREGDALDLEAIREELADVMISCANLAARLEIDLMAAVGAKIALNARKYPAELARGTAVKHDRLGEEASDG